MVNKKEVNRAAISRLLRRTTLDAKHAIAAPVQRFVSAARSS